jgi:hypothetical protein
MSDHSRRMRTRPLVALLGCAAAAAWADCPPGYQDLGGDCVKPSMTPGALCEPSAASQFPSTSPNYATKEFQQKKQEYILACIKSYEDRARLERAKAGGLTRAAAPSDVGGRAVPAPSSLLAREADRRRSAVDPSMVVESARPIVSLACRLQPANWFNTPSYIVTVTHAGTLPLNKDYWVHWAVLPTHAATKPGGSPPKGAIPLTKPLTPNADLKLVAVHAVPATHATSCTAVAK